MRYTKIALLVFGLGLLLGLVAVAVEIKRLDRVASGMMALGIAGIPIGMITDWRRAIKLTARTSRPRAKAPVRRTSPAPRRSRKPEPPKR